MKEYHKPLITEETIEVSDIIAVSSNSDSMTTGEVVFWIIAYVIMLILLYLIFFDLI